MVSVLEKTAHFAPFSRPKYQALVRFSRQLAINSFHDTKQIVQIWAIFWLHYPKLTQIWVIFPFLGMIETKWVGRYPQDACQQTWKVVGGYRPEDPRDSIDTYPRVDRNPGARQLYKEEPLQQVAPTRRRR